MLMKRRHFLKTLSTSALMLSASQAVGQLRASTPGEYLFNWYCTHFYDFRAQLPSADLNFIEQTLDLEGNLWTYDVDAGNDFIYSLITFSHRISGTHVNSTRVAMASIKNAAKLQPAIADVLDRNGVNPDTLPDFEHAIGLGWDQAEGHLKAYFYLPDITATQDSDIASLIDLVGHEAYYPMGLTSFTLKTDEPGLFEKKLYLGMQERIPDHVRDYPFAEQIVHTNYMVTTRRGIVPQVDLSQPFNTQQLTEPGRAIAAKYARLKESVDTVTYNDDKSYTLYFPSG